MESYSMKSDKLYIPCIEQNELLKKYKTKRNEYYIYEFWKQ